MGDDLMRRLVHQLSGGFLAPLLCAGTGAAALAADLAPSPPPVVATQVSMPPSWSYRVTPYGWLTALDGTQTVRGRSVKVNASFADTSRRATPSWP
jgi:hypothetical protein